MKHPKKIGKKVGASLLPLLTAMATIAPTSVYAQSASLEEVIVTAERRTQSTQDVPLAITTFSGDLISPAGITDISDIALKTPNLTVTQFNIGEPQLYLRGLGSTVDSAGADPTVSFFVDDVYIGRSGGATSDLYDIERIEVLRGPQGTLYGRNVTGGAVSVFTKNPTREFEAKAGFTVGDYGLTVLRGLVSAPLSDTLAGKVSISKRDRDGYAKSNRSGQDLDDADNISLKGKLLWDAGENTEVLFGFDYAKDETNGRCRNLTKLDPVYQDHRAGGAFVPILRQIAIDTNTTDPRTCGITLEQEANREVFGTSMRVEHKFDNDMELVSISAYRELEYEWLQELSGLDSPPAMLSVEDNEGDNADQISQEFRLSKQTDNLFWVAGAFAFKENVDRFANVPIQFGDVIASRAGLLLDRSWTQKATNESMALFGQLTWSMTDQLDLTLGGRQTWDDKSMDNFYQSSPGNVVYDLKGLNKSWSQFTPRATLDFKVNEDVMLFATYSEGYKSGVFISQNTNATLASEPLSPESATNIELGARTEWLDNRLRVNMTYFQLDNEDQQVFRLADFTLISENQATETDGVEIDFAAQLSPNLMLSGYYSKLDARVVGGSSDGNVAARAPDNKYSVSLAYNKELNNGGELNFDVSASYTDQFYTENTNEDVSFHDDNTVVDAQLRYTAPNNAWDVTLWGKNLSDELITSHAIVSSFGGSVELYAPPKTVGVTANIYFQ